jgi:sugar phosphate isomerase/epimerase
MKMGTMDHVVQVAGASYLDMARTAKSLGFQGLEVGIRRADMQDASNRRLDELKRLKGETGLEIPSICMGEYHGLMVKPRPADQAMAEMKKAVQWAGELGAKVMLVPFFFEGELKTPEDFSDAVKHFKILCELAGPSGVNVCYEGTIPGEKFCEIAEQIAMPNFGVYYDLANYYWLGMDGPDQIRKHGKYIKQVHLKETKVGPGDVPPGQGRVNYAESAQALKEVGYDGWLVFETPSGPPAEVQKDIEFARKYFKFE